MTNILMIDKTLPLDSGLNDRNIRIAGDALATGGLVAFPTETVYGLGVRPNDPAARKRLIDAKGRDEGKPITLLFGDVSAAKRAMHAASGTAWTLARVFWPGALTLVVPSVFEPGEWQGIRVSSEPIVSRLLADVPGGGVLAPSANLSGGAEPVCVSDFIDDLIGVVDVVLDAGAITGNGLPSTVVKVDGGDVDILRAGAISPKRITDAARPSILIVAQSAGYARLAATATRALLSDRNPPPGMASRAAPACLPVTLPDLPTTGSRNETQRAGVRNELEDGSENDFGSENVIVWDVNDEMTAAADRILIVDDQAADYVESSALKNDPRLRFLSVPEWEKTPAFPLDSQKIMEILSAAIRKIIDKDNI